MEIRDIKTLDIAAKEWFDKTAGNSYFSARIIINFGCKEQQKICLPFQYGYDSHYEQEALETISGKIAESSLWRWCEENDILLRSSKISNCLQRDVKSWGKE